MRLVTAALAFAALAGVRVAEAGPAEDLVSQAMAATPDPQHGMVLYLKHCAGCHGRHAWGEGALAIPVLAGQHEKYLIRALAGFVHGVRQGVETHAAVMRETLQPPDVNRPQAFRDLAAYLSGAARNPHADTGPGRALTDAERNYRRGCSSCHGTEGAGSDQQSIPAIGGQGYDYLRAQLRSFSSGRGVHPALANSPVALSVDEQQAVADYASRLSYLSSASGR
jgi:cytochrome c553